MRRFSDVEKQAIWECLRRGAGQAHRPTPGQAACVPAQVRRRCRREASATTRTLCAAPVIGRARGDLPRPGHWVVHPGRGGRVGPSAATQSDMAVLNTCHRDLRRRQRVGPVPSNQPTRRTTRYKPDLCPVSPRLSAHWGSVIVA